MRFSTSSATLAFIAAFASAAPSSARKWICAALRVEPGVCYNWASFPAEDVAPLINNLTFVEIPVVHGGIYGCDIYL
ncbi:hypothetical protein BKA65DRAFT_560503 [Rhexocercosporidium sp. MPI-PUGE-AT-0058]|nr:hypothetical protein BKA65DRAFT_560503 [Rhexocercosporidium sp. MPI-PUGE-AT-0058]